MDEIRDTVNKMVEFLSNSIQKYEGYGSGYKCDDTEYISIEIGFMKASTYGDRVELPAIISPNAVLDLVDVPENECFPFAFLASKHYGERQRYKHDVSRVSRNSIAAYQRFKNRYIFPKNLPVTKEQAKAFCRKYNTRLCIFTYLADSEDVASTCYMEPEDIKDVGKQDDMVRL
jgi:hypothetical protein